MPRNLRVPSSLLGGVPLGRSLSPYPAVVSAILVAAKHQSGWLLRPGDAGDPRMPENHTKDGGMRLLATAAVLVGFGGEKGRWWRLNKFDRHSRCFLPGMEQLQRWDSNGGRGLEYELVASSSSGRTVTRGGGIYNLDHDYDESDEDDSSPSSRLRRTSSSSLSALSSWYSSALERHELPTKCASSGVLAAVGDVVAQLVTAEYGNSIPTKAAFRLDKRRTLAMFADGLVVTAPLLHYVYGLYERIAPTEERREGDDESASSAPFGRMGRARAVAIHILLDNFVMVYLYVALMMAVTSLLEGRILTIIPEMKEGYFLAVRASMKVSLLGYAPVEFMSFYSLPRNLRVLAVSASVDYVLLGWRIVTMNSGFQVLEFAPNSSVNLVIVSRNLALIALRTGERDGRSLGRGDELCDAQEQALKIQMVIGNRSGCLIHHSDLPVVSQGLSALQF